MASPVLIGAVTVLVATVAVFLAYNANQGLPFVPTYTINAELPSGGKLVKGNEVRIGGFRVGLITEIRPRTIESDTRRRAIAVAELKLDKQVEPLAADTQVVIRPRSALGLKYLELTPGTLDEQLSAGDTIALSEASEPPELEDVFSIFEPRTRRAVQQATAGFGDAFAGRGTSLNTAVGALNPFFRSLEPVMRNLASPRTRLDAFFRELGRAAAQAAPVARTQAELFGDVADTFGAIARDERALAETIEKSPPTIETAIHSFAVQRPFLAEFADLSRRLRPAARELPRTLPAISQAMEAGIPVLPRSVELNERLADANTALGDLFENPSTLLALKDVRAALAVGRPAIEFIAPYQTVCNDGVYFLVPLGEVQSQVQTGPSGGGTVLQQGVKVPNSRQPNNYGTTEGSRNWDVPPDMDPIGARDRFGSPLMRLHGTPYPPAIDARGNADCQVGQFGYPRGPLVTDGRWGKGLLPDGTPTGGNWPIVDNDYAILSGPTFKAEELGIDHLEDVP